MTAAPSELRTCGCTTRKAAWRPYVKGTQARSPKTSMKPKPSCTMSIVVRTASCYNTKKPEINSGAVCVDSLLGCDPADLSPHSTERLPRTAAGNSWPVSWPERGNLEAPPLSSACPGLWPPETQVILIITEKPHCKWWLDFVYRAVSGLNDHSENYQSHSFTNIVLYTQNHTPLIHWGQFCVQCLAQRRVHMRPTKDLLISGQAALTLEVRTFTATNSSRLSGETSP